MITSLDLNETSANQNYVYISDRLISKLIKHYDYKEKIKAQDAANLLFKQCFLAQNSKYYQYIMHNIHNNNIIKEENYIYDWIDNIDWVKDTNWVKNNKNFYEKIDRKLTNNNNKMAKAEAHQFFLQMRKAIQTALFIANKNSVFYLGYILPPRITQFLDNTVKELMIYEKAISNLYKDPYYGAQTSDISLDVLLTRITYAAAGIALTAIVANSYQNEIQASNKWFYDTLFPTQSPTQSDTKTLFDNIKINNDSTLDKETNNNNISPKNDDKNNYPSSLSKPETVPTINHKPLENKESKDPSSTFEQFTQPVTTFEQFKQKIIPNNFKNYTHNFENTVNQAQKITNEFIQNKQNENKQYYAGLNSQEKKDDALWNALETGDYTINPNAKTYDNNPETQKNITSGLTQEENTTFAPYAAVALASSTIPLAGIATTGYLGSVGTIARQGATQGIRSFANSTPTFSAVSTTPTSATSLAKIGSQTTILATKQFITPSKDSSTKPST